MTIHEIHICELWLDFGLMAQLVVHCVCMAEVRVRIPPIIPVPASLAVTYVTPKTARSYTFFP